MILMGFYFEKVDRFLTENSFTLEINTRKTQNQNYLWICRLYKGFIVMYFNNLKNYIYNCLNKNAKTNKPVNFPVWDHWIFTNRKYYLVSLQVFL